MWRAGLVKAGGAGQRLGRDVHAELPCDRIEPGDGHAGAIERDAVAEADIVQVCRRGFEGQPLAVGRRAAEGVHGDDAPDAGDDSGEHRGIFAEIAALPGPGAN
jgi:hypothetical protein